MKAAEWHQRGRSGDFIVKLNKKYTFFTILRLDRRIPDGRLISENLFPKQQFKESSQGTVLAFHGNRHRVAPDI